MGKAMVQMGITYLKLAQRLFLERRGTCAEDEGEIDEGEDWRVSFCRIGCRDLSLMESIGVLKNSQIHISNHCFRIGNGNAAIHIPKLTLSDRNHPVCKIVWAAISNHSMLSVHHQNPKVSFLFNLDTSYPYKKLSDPVTCFVLEIYPRDRII